LTKLHKGIILYKAVLLEAYFQRVGGLQMATLEIEITPPLREKLELYCRLHDIYSALLTEKQNKCFSLYYLEDLSMSEIGGIMGITPQGVADRLKRSIKLLQRYENKLGFLEHQNKLAKKSGELAKAVDSLLGNSPYDANLLKLKDLIGELCDGI